jgi:hypothetical protein
VRQELAAVYRDMRSGAIPSGTGTRLAFTLQVLGKLIEAEQFEARIDALEAAYRDDEVGGEARPH